MHKYSSNCKTQLKMVLGLLCTGACLVAKKSQLDPALKLAPGLHPRTAPPPPGTPLQLLQLQRWRGPDQRVLHEKMHMQMIKVHY